MKSEELFKELQFLAGKTALKNAVETRASSRPSSILTEDELCRQAILRVGTAEQFGPSSQAMLLAKLRNGAAAGTARMALEIATLGGAACLGRTGELGVLEPILVRKRSPDGFSIIAGERRWRAAQRAQKVDALF